MGLFNRRILIDLRTIASMCGTLSAELKDHYQQTFASNDEEWKRRGEIFDKSGIHKFSSSHFTNSTDVMPGSLKYCISESAQVTRVRFDRDNYYRRPEDTDYVWLEFFSVYVEKVDLVINFRAQMSERKWKRNYSTLKLGDTIKVDAPIDIYFNHSPRGLDIPRDTLQVPPGRTKCFMEVTITAYLSLSR